MFPRENKKVRTVNSKTNLHIETHKNVGGKRKSSYYNFVFKRLSNSYKQASKRAPFTMQKGVFYTSKGHVLHCKRCPFRM